VRPVGAVATLLCPSRVARCAFACARRALFVCTLLTLIPARLPLLATQAVLFRSILACAVPAYSGFDDECPVLRPSLSPHLLPG
jgi:hypothetical protein